MKKALILLLFILSFININSQNKVDKTMEKQFYEDYDQFLNIVESINPQSEVRKIVTGENLLDTIKALRKSIQDIRSPQEFTGLINLALYTLNDQHSTLLYNKDQFAFTDFDSLEIHSALQAIDLWKQNNAPHNIRNHFPIYLEYSDGEYILAFDFKMTDITNHADTSVLPAGSIIKFINEKEVETYFKNSLYYYRWDYIHKKKHAQVRGYLKDLKLDIPVTISYLDNNNQTRNFTFDPKKNAYAISSPAFLFYSGQNPRVDYFDEDGILYIRMPKMADAEFYTSQIIEKTQKKKVKKVIWDIRRNPGGNDAVWNSTLSSLLKDTLKYEMKLATLDSDLANQLIEENLRGIITRLPFLEGKYRVFRTPYEIIPAENSIGYEGTIYLLQDKQIYSSAGSLSAVARVSDKITSIGTNTGNMIGTGITPLSFQLKNSKLVFQLEPILDITNVNSPYDYYQDSVEIPVNLSRDDWANYLKASNETLYSKDFLYNIDPVFRKALEME